MSRLVERSRTSKNNNLDIYMWAWAACEAKDKAKQTYLIM